MNYRVLLDDIVIEVNTNSEQMVDDIKTVFDKYDIDYEVKQGTLVPTGEQHKFIETHNYIIDPTIRHILKNVNGYEQFKYDYIFDKELYGEIIENGNI